jgi:hypothetical protein
VGRPSRFSRRGEGAARRRSSHGLATSWRAAAPGRDETDGPRATRAGWRHHVILRASSVHPLRVTDPQVGSRSAHHGLRAAERSLQGRCCACRTA